MRTMSTWILSMKVLLISAGVLSLAMGLRFSVPVIVDGIPSLSSVILSWLKPPYLYIIINGIIITIAASSRFHQSKSDPPPPPPVRSEYSVSLRSSMPSDLTSFAAAQTGIGTVMDEPSVLSEAVSAVLVSESEDSSIMELKPVLVNGSIVDIPTERVEAEAEDVFPESESKYYNTPLLEAISAVEADDDVFPESEFKYYNTPLQETFSPELQFESILPAREKPLVSSRFGNRKPIRTGHEASGMRALRVAKPKRHETLENTWKMISAGRHVPLTRHLAADHTPKPETFKDRTNYEAAAEISRIRKEPSLSQDDLNRRVEAFIRKFNEDMRMQRQESLQHYMEMINRGV